MKLNGRFGQKAEAKELVRIGQAYGGGKTAALYARINNTDKTMEVDPAGDAKKSCKRCHGTGFKGTLCHTNGTREMLVCDCVVKAMKKRGL